MIHSFAKGQIQVARERQAERREEKVRDGEGERRGNMRDRQTYTHT